MPAADRRAVVVAAAMSEFAGVGYHSATMASVARAAGVTAALLYRHFPSKPDLFAACVEHAWDLLRAEWEAVLENEPDPTLWLPTMAYAFLSQSQHTGVMGALWFQAIAESENDRMFQGLLSRQMREVHAFVSAVCSRSQREGGINRERLADAEAWSFIAVGLLAAASRRMGGVVDPYLPDMLAERRKWLYGEPATRHPS